MDTYNACAVGVCTVVQSCLRRRWCVGISQINGRTNTVPSRRVVIGAAAGRRQSSSPVVLAMQGHGNGMLSWLMHARRQADHRRSTSGAHATRSSADDARYRSSYQCSGPAAVRPAGQCPSPRVQFVLASRTPAHAQGTDTNVLGAASRTADASASVQFSFMRRRAFRWPRLLVAMQLARTADAGRCRPCDGRRGCK
jgi:hypothetical protein